jgi:hypothetical protein
MVPLEEAMVFSNLPVQLASASSGESNSRNYGISEDLMFMVSL